MKQSKNQSQNTEQNQQLNDRPLACPERLWNYFSEVMEMRLNFSLVANSRGEIQSKIKKLFNIDIEDEIAHEFYILMYAITVNDSFYGYSKHNYTRAKIIADNRADLSNVPEVQQALIKNERAKQLSQKRKSVESNFLKEVSEVIKTHNRLMEECLDITRVKSEEVQNSNYEIDLDDDILFPNFLELQIKVTTNFQTVARKLNKYSKTEIPETEVFSIKIKDGVEAELILDAIKEMGYERKIQGPYRSQFMVPEVDKPYHALVGALQNFMEAVLPENSKTRNKQFVNWILGESGILMSEALFYKIETETKSTSYGDYKDYLKSVDPNRDR